MKSERFRMVQFPRSLTIGRLTIQPATVLAPMAGVTDSLFRKLIREQGGCGLVMTEFTSSHGILQATCARKPTRSLQQLYFDPDEHPISAQLFGADPGVLAEAARVCEDLGFDAVDLNLGCPAKKVVGSNGGSGLLRNLPLIARILEAIRRVISIPLTVKCRLGWDDTHLVHLELGRIAEETGCDAIALHPRTRQQGYSGRADWSRIAELKAAVRIPVIGNGDIRQPEDAVRMVVETGCDGVMIGRAAAWNPWIFRQLQEYIETGYYTVPTEQDRYRLIWDYFTRLVALGRSDALGKMKQFTSLFTHGVRNGSELRAAVHQARSVQEVFARVRAFFEGQGANEETAIGAPVQSLTP